MPATPEDASKAKRFAVDVVKPVEIFVPGFRPVEDARGPEFYAPRKSEAEGSGASPAVGPIVEEEEDISDEAMHELHRHSYKEERKLYLGALLEQAKTIEEDVKTGRKSHKKISDRTCSLTGDVIFDKRSAAESNVGGGSFVEDRLDTWVLEGIGPFADEPPLAEEDYVEDRAFGPRGVNWPRSPYLEATGYYERREAVFAERRKAKGLAEPGTPPPASLASPSQASPSAGPRTGGVKLIIKRSPLMKVDPKAEPPSPIDVGAE